ARRVDHVIAPTRGIPAAAPMHGVVPPVLLDGDSPYPQSRTRMVVTPFAGHDRPDIPPEGDRYGPTRCGSVDPDRCRGSERAPPSGTLARRPACCGWVGASR